MEQNKGQLASFAILLLIVSNSMAMDLVFLGGLSISDFSMETQLPEEIDFNESSGTSCMILRTSESLNSSIALGIECFVPTGSYKWECESDSSSRIQQVGEWHIELCLRWQYPTNHITPFVRAGAGVHWSYLRKTYVHGDLEVTDNDPVTRAPGLTLGAGVRIPLRGSLFLQGEADYSLVSRDEFQGWQVTEVNNMNSWKLMAGLGVEL